MYPEQYLLPHCRPEPNGVWEQYFIWPRMWPMLQTHSFKRFHSKPAFLSQHDQFRRRQSHRSLSAFFEGVVQRHDAWAQRVSAWCYAWECVEVIMDPAGAHISTLTLPGRLPQSQIVSSPPMLPFMVCFVHCYMRLSGQNMYLRRFYRKFDNERTRSK